MTRDEALRAMEALAASPAAAWIGNKVVGNTLIRKCTRCGTKATLEFPPNIHGPANVPAGFDAKLYAWMRAFQIAHETCTESTRVDDAFDHGGES